MHIIFATFGYVIEKLKVGFWCFMIPKPGPASAVETKSQYFSFPLCARYARFEKLIFYASEVR